MDLLIIAVVGLLAIAGATQISDRVRVAPALLLLAGGIVVGFLPVVPAIEVEPEIILEGILPPLLYATAVGISTINFRRELASVVVLAILLVIVSAAVIGGVLTLVIPGLSPAWAIAVGAVLSPTDAWGSRNASSPSWRARACSTTPPPSWSCPRPAPPRRRAP